jgi:pimeloyl-ACP methyl ester carboxylesterase
MNTQESDSYYAEVPDYQKDMLRQFRATHPYREMVISGKKWRYLSSGQGDKCLVFLPGGFITGDMWFYPTLKLESSYRILSPDAYTRQGFSGMAAVCDAIVKMMDSENVDKATLIGLSAGGGIAQVFLQTYPERVSNLVLSHCGILKQDLGLAKRAERLSRLAKILPVSVVRWIIKKQTTGAVPESSEWVSFEAAYFREIGAEVTKSMFVDFLADAAETRRNLVAKPEIVQAWPGSVFVLTSEDDSFSFNSLEQLEDYYPRVDSYVFPEGGHHALFFYPKQYTEALIGFLDSVNE